MNDIIREIEKAQLNQILQNLALEIQLKYLPRLLKAQENVSRYLKELYLKDRMVEPGKHLQ